MTDEIKNVTFKYDNEDVTIELTNEFAKAIDLLENTNQSFFITGKAGCLGIGTKVLMFDGSFKNVEEIIVGDQLMGIDSKPRNVLSLCQGKEQMYWIHQKKGISYRVNESHILSLKHVIPAKKNRIKLPNGKRERILWSNFSEKKVETLNISVKDYLNLSKGSIKRKHSKGYKSGIIEFKEISQIIDPYYFGLWLGNGHTNDINRITNFDEKIVQYLINDHLAVKLGNSKGTFVVGKKMTQQFKKLYSLSNANKLKKKYIPRTYRINSKENRLKLIAGLIDSDGSYDKNGKYFELTLANETLVNDIAFVTRSLGFATTLKKTFKKCTNCKDSKKEREAWCVRFIPNLNIPTILERKQQKQISSFKNRLHSGIIIEKDIIDDYYGFMLDGDHLFILEDFTVTHNTGKSTLLRYFRSITEKRHAVVAFTGLAAINVNAQTIHSLFLFPIGFIHPNQVKFKQDLVFLLRGIDVLIVDEVSMLRADLMDAIDKSLRIHRESDKPFGGVQMIFIGDMYQLPPIVDKDLSEVYSRYYKTPYFFSADVFSHMKLPLINLERIHRQNDPVFIDILNNVRERKNLQTTLARLNKNVNYNFNDIKEGETVMLTTTNEKARELNSFFLNKLTTEEYSFPASIDGDFDPKSYPTEERLQFKEGAKIMFIKNDPDKFYVNGDIGVIVRLLPFSIEVKCRGCTFTVKKQRWEKFKYKYVPSEIEGDRGNVHKEVVGSFEQYPLRLAWAITVHKSQGQTYNSVFIDLHNGSFTSGQTYVALSRCKTLEGIALQRPIKESDIILDHRISEFSKTFEEI